MPYIPPEQRRALDPLIADIVNEIRHRAVDKQDGAVNYVISRVLLEVYDMRVEPSYFRFNRAVGVAEAVKLELYRRFIGPHEDGAVERNGDL